MVQYQENLNKNANNYHRQTLIPTMDNETNQRENTKVKDFTYEFEMVEEDKKRRLTLATFIDKKESKSKTAAIESLFDEDFKKIRELDNITNYDLI